MGSCWSRSSHDDPLSYEMLEKIKEEKTAIHSWLDQSLIHGPDIYCSSCMLNVSQEDSDTCTNIRSYEELKQYLSDCTPYYAWLRQHRGDIVNRNEFYDFIHSGRLWILHIVHAEKCETMSEEYIRVNTEGLQEWFGTFLMVYLNNVYNPHLQMKVRPTSPQTSSQRIPSRILLSKKVAPTKVKTPSLPTDMHIDVQKEEREADAERLRELEKETLQTNKTSGANNLGNHKYISNDINPGG